MCNKMQSIWDYMRTYVYMCLEVCTHVVLVVCESVYAFRFLYPLCACVCVCLCARAHTPVGLLIFTEGARMNSSSDGESACSVSSYPHLGLFCLRSAWPSLSPEGGFCSPFSWSQSKMKLKGKSRERIYKLEHFIFSERAVICSEIHRMSSAVRRFSHLFKEAEAQLKRTRVL